MGYNALVIRIETPNHDTADFTNFQRLARQCQNEIGQLSPEMLHKYVHVRGVQALTDGQDLLGFVISRHRALPHGRYPGESRIYVAAIDYSMRNRLFGTTLINDAVRRAQLAGNAAIGLWCAEDIEANAFWKTLGFQVVGERSPTKIRKRKHFHYRLQVPNVPTLFQ